MQNAICSFQDDLGGLFKEMILGVAAHNAGMSRLADKPHGAVSLLLSGGTETQAIMVAELVQRQEEVRQGVLELFQNKAIARWNDLIDDLFSVAVDEHLGGAKKWAVIKVRGAKYDFASGIPLEDQVKTTIKGEFGFQDYATRIGIIVKLFGLNQNIKQLLFIKKHVEIRNAYQHHNGLMHSKGMSLLGVVQITVKDLNDRDVVVKIGEKVTLSVMELDLLRSYFCQVVGLMERYIEKN